MFRHLPALALLFAAAPAVAQRPMPAEDYSRRLAALDELSRYATLRRVIATSGQPCRRVESAAPRGRYRNLVMWAVRCTSVDFGLFIGPDSSVQVRRCAQLAQLKLPPCNLPPRPAT